jgi:hypothetical protein
VTHKRREEKRREEKRREELLLHYQSAVLAKKRGYQLDRATS